MELTIINTFDGSYESCMWEIDHSTRMNTIYVIYHEHILLTFENYTQKNLFDVVKDIFQSFICQEFQKLFTHLKSDFCYLSQENRLIRIYNNIDVEHKDEMIVWRKFNNHLKAS